MAVAAVNKKSLIKGFTLLEILVVMGIFVTIAAIAFPTTIGQLQKVKVEDVANNMSSLTFAQQQNALSGLNNKNYGIAFQTNRFILFTGNSLASAESTENIDLPNGMTISQINLSASATEITFTKGSFRPSQYGNINITDGSKVFTVLINKEGLINYF